MDLNITQVKGDSPQWPLGIRDDFFRASFVAFAQYYRAAGIWYYATTLHFLQCTSIGAKLLLDKSFSLHKRQNNILIENIPRRSWKKFPMSAAPMIVGGR